jgi:hypothetical protein
MLARHPQAGRQAFDIPLERAWTLASSVASSRRRLFVTMNDLTVRRGWPSGLTAEADCDKGRLVWVSVLG